MKDITAKKLRDAADAVKRWICNNPDAVCLDKLWKAGRTAADLLDRLAEREQLAAERELRAAGRELIRQARMAITDAGDALDKVDAEPASDAVRTSARAFIAAVDEHCELEVCDKVEIIGLPLCEDDYFSDEPRGLVTTIRHDYHDGDYQVKQGGIYPASSLRKITAPAPLLPVGTLAVTPFRYDGRTLHRVIGHDGLEYELQSGNSKFHSSQVKPLIPAYLMLGSQTFPTTSSWTIGGNALTGAELMVQVRNGNSTHYWPLADCLPLALDSRWEVK